LVTSPAYRSQGLATNDRFAEGVSLIPVRRRPPRTELCGLLLAFAWLGCATPAGTGEEVDDNGDEDEESGGAEESLPPLEPRPAAVDCTLVGTPAGALPRLQAELGEAAPFEAPTQIVAHPLGLVVVEAGGRVWRIVDGVREAEPWLDLGAVVAGAPTRGLTAVALGQGWLYAHYHLATTPRRSRVVRIPIPADDSVLDPTQAVTMLEIDHGEAGLASGAVGGALGLDEQGRLLIGVGEGTGAAAAWPYDAPAQDRSDWRGSVLRVVAPADPTAPGYEVPPDNPWVGDPSARPELYAIGLHDPRHLVLGEGTWWVSDSGTSLAEFSRLVRGGNLGWPVTEGWSCTGVGDCDATSYVGPSFHYPTDGDHCRLVAGALVLGDELPGLAGALLWADRCSGRLWGFDPTPAMGLAKVEVLGRAPAGVQAIGRDGAGEPWIVDGDGRLARLGLHEHGLPGSLPERLSETECFAADLVSPRPELIPFLVASPLWSDGLLKQRYLVVPPERYVEREADGRWRFPDGSVVIKTFVLEAIEGDPASRRPIETRFMVRRDGVWDFHSYRWRDDGSDADRLSAGAELELAVETPAGVEHFGWGFPSEIDCRNCHGFGDGELLGPHDLQMHRVVRYGEEPREQLLALAEIGLFAAPLDDLAGLPRLVDPLDEDASLDDRARAYLHANCGHCHQPKWMRPDLRWTTPWAETGACGVPIEFPSLAVGGALRVAPGDPHASNLWLRMGVRGEGQMPLVGSGRVDAAALELIEAWILAMSGCP
jgi:uncharacterized repeat protein (TIGR03806 family)